MSQPSTTEEQRLAHGERVVAHLRAGGTLGDLMGVQDAELDAAYAMACFFYERDESPHNVTTVIHSLSFLICRLD